MQFYLFFFFQLKICCETAKYMWRHKLYTRFVSLMVHSVEMSPVGADEKVLPCSFCLSLFDLMKNETSLRKLLPISLRRSIIFMQCFRSPMFVCIQISLSWHSLYYKMWTIVTCKSSFNLMTRQILHVSSHSLIPYSNSACNYCCKSIVQIRTCMTLLWALSLLTIRKYRLQTMARWNGRVRETKMRQVLKKMQINFKIFNFIDNIWSLGVKKIVRFECGWNCATIDTKKQNK